MLRDISAAVKGCSLRMPIVISLILRNLASLLRCTCDWVGRFWNLLTSNGRVWSYSNADVVLLKTTTTEATPRQLFLYQHCNFCGDSFSVVWVQTVDSFLFVPRAFPDGQEMYFTDKIFPSIIIAHIHVLSAVWSFRAVMARLNKPSILVTCSFSWKFWYAFVCLILLKGSLYSLCINKKLITNTGVQLQEAWPLWSSSTHGGRKASNNVPSVASHRHQLKKCYMYVKVYAQDA
jgi:hypothetical protein